MNGWETKKITTKENIRGVSFLTSKCEICGKLNAHHTRTEALKCEKGETFEQTTL